MGCPPQASDVISRDEWIKTNLANNWMIEFLILESDTGYNDFLNIVSPVCGWKNISENECFLRGCCWNSEFASCGSPLPNGVSEEQSNAYIHYQLFKSRSNEKITAQATETASIKPETKPEPAMQQTTKTASKQHETLQIAASTLPWKMTTKTEPKKQASLSTTVTYPAWLQTTKTASKQHDTLQITTSTLHWKIATKTEEKKQASLSTTETYPAWLQTTKTASKQHEKLSTTELTSTGQKTTKTEPTKPALRTIPTESPLEATTTYLFETYTPYRRRREIDEKKSNNLKYCSKRFESTACMFDNDSDGLANKSMLQQQCVAKGCCWDDDHYEDNSNMDFKKSIKQTDCKWRMSELDFPIPSSFPSLEDNLKSCCDSSPCFHVQIKCSKY